MDFNKLDENTKQKIHEEVLSNANSIGGKNFFLQMIEEIKQEKPTPMINKSGSFHFSKGRITLSKSMFKETHTLLFDAIRREEKTGDMLNGVSPKEYKAVMNMMRTLRPVRISVIPKADIDGIGFSFDILDSSQEKQTKVDFMFKLIFFYSIDEAKKALNYGN